jgi:hypothetical protein
VLAESAKWFSGIKRIVACATCAVHADPKLDLLLRELLMLTVAMKKVEGVDCAPELFPETGAAYETAAVR